MEHQEQSQMTGNGWQVALQVANVRNVVADENGNAVLPTTAVLFNKTTDYKTVNVVCALPDKVEDPDTHEMVDATIDIILSPREWSPVIVKKINNVTNGELQYGY